MDSKLSIQKKQEVLLQLLRQLRCRPFEIEASDSFYKFRFYANNKFPFGSAFDAYANVDDETFYLSIQGTSGGRYGSGFFDFGGTEDIRLKIVSDILELINK